MRICDICQEIIITDNHHIQSRVYGGSNSKWNRCKLCPNCHRKVHTGFIIIEGWFAMTSMGKTLIHREKGQTSITCVEDPKVWLFEG